MYDLSQHLLGEYDGASGQALREYIWLQDVPVAMITPDPAAPAGQPLVYFIHTDHLNTPRVVQDRNNAVRWRWLDEPFGSGLAEADPSALGPVAFNLRFPGQYFDAESGWHYNMNRYFEPGTGRYTQSDPIGLAGGINTYSYVGGNPVSYVDPMGAGSLRRGARGRRTKMSTTFVRRLTSSEVVTRTASCSTGETEGRRHDA